MAYNINIRNFGKTILAQKGEVLADKILECGIDLSLYCQKRGVCGKCFVKVLEGHRPPLDEMEGSLVRKNRLSQDHRLACRYKVKGDMVIDIPHESLIQKTLILKTGMQMPIAVEPMVRKYFLELVEPAWDHPHSLLSVLKKQLRKKTLDIPLDTLRALPNKLKRSGFKITAVLYDDSEVLDVEPGDTTARSYGLAVDVGTTTLVVELIDLNTGKSIDTATENNSQMKYGMDIVSRISFAYHNPGNLKKLQAAVLDTLSLMIDHTLKKNRISRDYVYEIVFAGNTAMNHFILGVPVDTLAVSPFHAVFHKLAGFKAKELGLQLNPKAKAYVVPNIKSFVGGDISAGIQATDFANREGKQLLIDLGTNGEIVLKTEKEFVATSTAAGPAFEGMDIGSGMLALPGAIYKAEKKKRLVLHTIGKQKARGICGTGLIDLVALYLDEGKITPSGKIAGTDGMIKVTDKIFLSQQDIRKIQLAVAAVKTGVRLICEKHRIREQNLDGIFIAGAFGNYMNTKNAMKIGLLPNVDTAKIIFVGNSSIAGAKALLLSKEARQKTASSIKKIHYVSLASDPRFQECFVDSLNFGSGESSR